MARTNKYSSINFNDIYEKKVGNNSSSSSSFPSPSSSLSSSASSLTSPNKTIISNSRIHGHMLVLSKPATPKPKPIVVPQNPAPKTPALTKPDKVPDQTGSEPDNISLRPQGRTGSGSPVTLSPLPSPGKPASPLTAPLLKSDRFVPPHLRPGFAGREAKLPGPEAVKGGLGSGRGKGQFGAPNHYGEEGRPKSGGGYERMRRIGAEPEAMNFTTRPGSSGARPSSSG
ncbi:basic salivary proline-rich protein 4 [Coffea eugenioides]|uniref:basic salivary proline-rich protein 4 n=1 Tax=Coffea eugenioides TaxID=49369 RepID=UPI000F5CB950|nr:basic salivary proline-rich protein 4-like [Coffea arabica]XP_027171142.1 basic salivary proline-rich protein 4 [Coffea eugenioides]